MTTIILIIARMRSALQGFPCTAHACYVTFVFKIEMETLPHSSSEVPAQFPILCVFLMSSNWSFVNNRRRRQCARAFAYVMAERRRSAHAIDDQNNGGRSQQGTQERKRRPMAGFITLLQNCILFKSTCPLEGAALCSWRVVHYICSQ